MHRRPGLLALSAAAGVALLLARLTSISAAPAVAQLAEPSCPAQSDQIQPLMAKAGNMFAIGLPSNPTTGFLWRMDTSPDSTVAQLVAAVYVAPAPPSAGPPVAGAGGRECWIFSAVGAGQTTITLDYLRPFDPPGTPPGQSDTFAVVVAGS